MFMFLPEIWLSVPEVILEIFLNMMRKICVYLPPNYTIQNKLRTNCSQTCQRQSFELNDLKF